jgi:hypothetical protein
VCSLFVPVLIYMALLFAGDFGRDIDAGTDGGHFRGGRIPAGAANDVETEPSLLDDAVFNSEVTIGFYLLPALLAGVGIDVISHVLIRHLENPQETFRREHRHQ